MPGSYVRRATAPALAQPAGGPPPTGPAGPGARVRRQGFLVRALVVVGLLVLVYPAAADWFSARNHNNELTEYTQSVSATTPAERSAARRMAENYNRQLPQGVLRDPYTSGPASESAEQHAYATYEELLTVSDNGVIGRVRYPDVGIDLPIYHGTDDDVIAKGAGHIYGSSLPIGGPSTHSVLTAHSGLVHARLFTPLHDAAEGETFSVEVLGELHFYRVDAVTIVDATETRALRIVAGEDYVTLLTCTPVGVNSHRLLVRGERIAPPQDEYRATSGEEVVAGFPWWALVVVAGTVAVVVLTAPRRRRSAPEQESSR